MTVGEKIKLHRKGLGLTQTELGEKLGVKKNAVSKWECGRVDDIPQSKIKALASLFNVPISYLIDDEKAPIQTDEREIDDPDIRMIARAGRKMTPEQRENLRKYAQYMFPEAFEDDNT